MKSNNVGIQSNNTSLPLSTQARLLMSEKRQRVQNRQQVMLQRAASEIGLDV